MADAFQMDLDSQNNIPCGLCGRTLSSHHQLTTSLQPPTFCDDCRFLLSRPTRTTTTYSPLTFSRDFSLLINQARHLDPDLPDSDSNVSVLLPPSSHTTPTGSGRWPRFYSDSETDAFNSEVESNISTAPYRVYHGDTDSISFTSYEGDSGVSVDGHTYADIFVHSVERSGIDTDSDIDPMHAGAIHWNADDNGVDHWVETDADDNLVRPHDRDFYGERELSRADSYGFEGMIRQRINEVRELQIPRIHIGLNDFNEAPHRHSDNHGDYFDAREIEEFLENLAENDSSRQGTPPAALSSIDNLPLVVISDEHVKSDGLACAICKDLLMIGTKVNQLPCFHLYHPSCILPWLSARNSCPLCRYELPTDDIDYELGKRNANHRMLFSEIQVDEDRDDSSSVTSNTREMVEHQDVVSRLEDVGPTAGLSHTNYRRGGWLFLSAVPIVGLAGIFCAFWLGNININPLVGRRGMTEQCNLHVQSSQPIQNTGLCLHNQRVKKWWWWF